jgi:ABC-type transport system substrate-binding protein
VRRALALAVDYGALGQGAFGDGWEYQGALNPAFPEAWSPDRVRNSPGHDSSATVKARDRQEASQLLAAAGFERGTGLTVGLSYLATNDAGRENTLRLQQQWATSFAAGTFTPRPIADNAQLTRVQSAGDFDALATVATAVPDAVLELTAHHHTGASRNYGGFSEIEADGLLDRALRTFDGPTRAGLLDTFQARFIEDWVPMVVLYAQPARNMLAGNVGGYATTAGPWYGLGSASRGGRWFYVS